MTDLWVVILFVVILSKSFVIKVKLNYLNFSNDFRTRKVSANDDKCRGYRMLEIQQRWNCCISYSLNVKNPQNRLV